MTMNKLDKFDLPSLDEARKRKKERFEVRKDLFKIPDLAKDIGKGRHYYLRTYGCQANVRDSENIAGILKELGYDETLDLNNADLILLNTCAVRQNAEEKVLGEIGNLKKLKRQNPELIISLCGCMAQEEGIVKTILRKYPQVDLIFGTHNIYHLPELLYRTMLEKERVVEVFSKRGEIIEDLPSKRFTPFKAWVNIMYGCDKFCSYCIVPYTRGQERSRDMEDILKEIKDLIAEGYKEVCLLGQNVNAYGKDLGMEEGFATLLEAVAKTGIKRIRFMTSHPYNFTDHAIEIMGQYQNIMPYVHLPLQSGSDTILKKMNRRYTSEDYKVLFDKLKKAIPGCAFTTDIIVGFPNESDEDFLKTLEMVDYCKYDNAFTFIYSRREGTPAASMEDTIAPEVKEKRLAILNKKVGEYAHLANERFLDQVVEVLVDGPSKKDPSVFSGYTKENKLVNFKGEGVKCGDIVKVKIVATKSFSLDGNLLKE